MPRAIYQTPRNTDAIARVELLRKHSGSLPNLRLSPITRRNNILEAVISKTDARDGFTLEFNASEFYSSFVLRSRFDVSMFQISR